MSMKRLRSIKTAGIGEIDFENKYTAIKMHFGEPGNLAFLRPNYAAVVVNTVKELGGRPFLTDCNTLYVGGRKNALDRSGSSSSPESSSGRMSVPSSYMRSEAYPPESPYPLMRLISLLVLDTPYRHLLSSESPLSFPSGLSFFFSS